MTTSILGRIARYGTLPHRDSREDRLTEICATLFDSCHLKGLARSVALGWLKHASEQAAVSNPARFDDLYKLLSSDDLEWSCRVATQVWFTNDDGARRPDLALLFYGPGPNPERVSLWVEVKHGTAPHTGQLRAYLEEQRALEMPGAAVLLLAPRADAARFGREQIPSEVPVLTWEETAQSIASYEVDGKVGEFLKRDLLKYLKEEGLVDPPQLTQAHIGALTNHREALNAVGRMADIADTYLQKHWNAGLDEYSESGVWERMYPPRPRASDDRPDADGSHFSWGVWYDGGHWFRDIARKHVPLFAAGMQLSGAISPTSASSLQRSNFGIYSKENVNYRGGGTRFYRTAYIDDSRLDLLSAKTLEEQGDALGRWVHEAFSDLRHALDAQESD